MDGWPLRTTPRFVAVLSNSTTEFISWSWWRGQLGLASGCPVPILSKLAESSRRSIPVCWTASIDRDLRHTQPSGLQPSAIRMPTRWRWCTTGNHQHRCGQTVQMMQWCQRYVLHTAKTEGVLKQIPVGRQTTAWFLSTGSHWTRRAGLCQSRMTRSRSGW